MATTRKIAFIIFPLILIAACARFNPPPPLTPEQIAYNAAVQKCQNANADLNDPPEPALFSACMSGPKEYRAAYQNYLTTEASPLEMCKIAHADYPNAKAILAKRHISCTAVFQEGTAKFDAPTLCSIWYSPNIVANTYIPQKSATAIVNAEVRSRGLNCTSLMAQQQELEQQRNALAVQTYQNQQLINAQQQAAYAQQQAAWAANRPRSTNCTGFGYSVNCTSY